MWSSAGKWSKRVSTIQAAASSGSFKIRNEAILVKNAIQFCQDLNANVAFIQRLWHTQSRLIHWPLDPWSPATKLLRLDATKRKISASQRLESLLRKRVHYHAHGKWAAFGTYSRLMKLQETFSTPDSKHFGIIIIVSQVVRVRGYVIFGNQVVPTTLSKNG